MFEFSHNPFYVDVSNRVTTFNPHLGHLEWPTVCQPLLGLMVTTYTLIVNPNKGKVVG